jgi:hypothetical protein
MNDALKRPFDLTPEERNTALWQKLLAHFEAKRQLLRVANDNPCEEAMTASRRGEIKAYTDLIRLNVPRKPPEQD